MLDGGRLAITSQAAGDVVYATSSTALGRVAIGTANKVVTSTGSAPQWSTQIVNAALPTNVDLAGTLDVTGVTTLDSDLAVNTNTLFVDQSEARVGIGTVDPLRPLHIFVSDVAATPNSNSFIVFEKNGDGNYIEFLAPDSVAEGGGIIFKSPSAEGSVNFNHSLATVQLGPNCSTTGSMSKGSGSFKISHPLPSKSDTHNLVHSFAESPETLLIYRGTVTLVAGQAEVDLDDAAGMTTGTWVLLCREEQCFTSNETGWFHVRGSVSGSTLTITCEEATCTDTVSWMVVANRHDENIKGANWTDENGYPIVEPEKVEGE